MEQINTTNPPRCFRTFTEYFLFLKNQIKDDCDDDRVIKYEDQNSEGVERSIFTIGQIKINAFNEIMDSAPTVHMFKQLEKELVINELIRSRKIDQNNLAKIINFINLFN